MTDVIAVDVGGTKLAAGVVRDDGTLVRRVDTPTPLDVDTDALFATLAGLVDRLDARDAVAVGVGCGGPMDRGGEHVSPLNIDSWRGFPLRERLAAHTARPVWVDNDAKALALGEGWLGAAVGAADYIGMVVSTGVGGGVVLDGRLLDGADGNAGHIGHVIVEPGGRECRVRRTRLPRGRGLGLGDRAFHRARPRRRRRSRCASARDARRPGGRFGGQPARPAARGRRAARSHSASASRSSPRLSASSTRAAVSTSPAAPGSCPARSGADGPLIGAARVALPPAQRLGQAQIRARTAGRSRTGDRGPEVVPHVEVAAQKVEPA